MSQSLGAALPSALEKRLSQQDLPRLLGRALPLLTVDDRGRPLLELWSMDVGDDGTVYGAGPVLPRPGDPCSPRLKRQFLNDSCFLVLRGIQP